MYTKETIDWEKVEPDIGTMSDRAVAKKHGISHAIVSERRHKLRREAGARLPRVNLGEYSCLLGKAIDIRVAEMAGVSESTVRSRRESAGIPPFRSRDANEYIFVRFKEYCDALSVPRAKRKANALKEQYREFCERAGIGHD
jgi:hypothetical protein